jgi:effector-binding domain-containing protein
MKNFFLLLVICSTLITSCNNHDKTEKPVTDTVKAAKPKAKSVATVGTKAVTKAPIINIFDTIVLKKIVIYVKDSAASSERISEKLAEIYGFKLTEVLKKNKLKVTGAPMAWYRSKKAPFFFEAGIPVDKKPAKLPKNFFVRTIGGDSAVVAHFFGPYDITNIGYNALTDWLKSRKKKKIGEPYEIYVTDPIDQNGKPLDPYRVQTDIVQPYN